MNILSKSLIVLATVSVCGCATPHVVEKTKVTDMKLSCPQIKSQIAEADVFEKKARDERKVNGKNVAAAVIFWPALLGTYSNTGKAIDAARDRKEYLRGLYAKRGC